MAFVAEIDKTSSGSGYKGQSINSCSINLEEKTTTK